jgi:hypothetical protein
MSLCIISAAGPALSRMHMSDISDRACIIPFAERDRKENELSPGDLWLHDAIGLRQVMAVQLCHCARVRLAAVGGGLVVGSKARSSKVGRLPDS